MTTYHNLLPKGWKDLCIRNFNEHKTKSENRKRQKSTEIFSNQTLNQKKMTMLKGKKSKSIIYQKVFLRIITSSLMEKILQPI